MGLLDLLLLFRHRRKKFSLVCLGEIPLNLTIKLYLKKETIMTCSSLCIPLSLSRRYQIGLLVSIQWTTKCFDKVESERNSMNVNTSTDNRLCMTRNGTNWWKWTSLKFVYLLAYSLKPNHFLVQLNKPNAISCMFFFLLWTRHNHLLLNTRSQQFTTSVNCISITLFCQLVRFTN